MSDMTTHDRALSQHRDAIAPVAGADAKETRLSALGAPAGARLAVVALLLAALWAGAYWALH